MNVTLYKQPDGRSEVINIHNVRPEDEAYFTRNGIKISMEDVGGEFAVYADIGEVTEDGDPDEVLVLPKGRSCEETMHALRLLCEDMKEQS